LRNALKQHPELQLDVFEALQRTNPAQLRAEGRVYGGGLHKVEPNELARIPARLVLDSVKTHVRIAEQTLMFV
jgi:adenine-specific DNA-methyltransferase